MPSPTRWKPRTAQGGLAAMAKTRYLGDDDLLLTASEAGSLLGVTATLVAAWAMDGHLTWADCPDGARRYPEPAVKALAARMETPRAPERLLTRSEVSAVLGVGVARVTDLRRAGAFGELPASPGGGRQLYPESRVMQALAERAHQARLTLHRDGLAASCKCMRGGEYHGVRESWTAAEVRAAHEAHVALEAGRD